MAISEAAQKTGRRSGVLRLRRGEAPPAVPADGGARLLRRITIGTAVTDALCIVAALAAAYQIRFGFGDVRPGYLAVVAVAPVVWLAVFAALRLHSVQHFAAEEEFRRVVWGCTLGIALIALGSYWSHVQFSRAWIGLAWSMGLALEMITRSAWGRRRRRLEAEGRIALRTLIVGTNEEAARLGQELREGLGFAPIGYVATSLPSASPNGLPVVGQCGALRDLIRDGRVQCIVVAASAIGVQEICDVARVTRQEGVELRISSRLPEVLTSRLSVRRIGRVATISVMPARLTALQRALKRTFDVAGASLLSVLTAPAWLGVALAVRLSSPGSVLFRQERVSTHGRPFTMLKFRTMTDGAAGRETTPFAKASADDPRLTRAGRALRRYSLDELPQLINVLRGEMSLVGPRPLPVEQVEANAALLEARHDVPAGMTGWWQIRGRSDVPADEALRLDLFYVENWSLLYDLYILARTLGAVVRGRGAV